MDLEKGDDSAPAGGGLEGVRNRSRRHRAGWQDRYLGHHLPPDQLRSREEVSGDRADLRRAAGHRSCRSRSCVGAGIAGAGRARLHRGADRRHGHQQPLQGVSRCGLQEPGRRRFPGSHPVAQGRGGEVPVVRHQRASASTARRRAGRTPGRRCCSIRSSTKWRCRTAAATTTGWTRSGGTSSGWAGRWGRSTASSSNVDNAAQLQGKLLLIIGELDTNVDPASTLQVVNALIKANKNFDLLVVPGADTARGAPISQHLLQDFFVHNLLAMEPPDWKG